MANTTWSGLTTEQQQEWDILWDEYVPSYGKADTLGGEILRAVARIIYRFYNDGDMAGIGYGNETVNSSDRFLSRVIPNYKPLDGIMFEDEYEKTMLENHRRIFSYIKDRAVFRTPNTSDSRTPNEDDYQRAREDYDNDWEEEE